MKNVGPSAPDQLDPRSGFEAELHCDTPLLPVSLPRVGRARATLTLLTGLRAGWVVSIDKPSTTIGRSADADIVVDDCGVSGHHACIARTSEAGYFVEDLGSTNGTFLGANRVDFAPLRGCDVVQLGPNIRFRFAIVDSNEAALHRRLYDSSVRDALTRVFNRRYLADRLVAEIARARRSASDLDVLMVDVDCLKQINDRFGHLAGDRALCAIAHRIQRALRVEDVLARYGGDEFVVLAVGGAGGDTFQLAERIRRTVDTLRMSARGTPVHVTVSIGVASLREVGTSDDDAAALIARADARLYVAKEAGRNRVCAS